MKLLSLFVLLFSVSTASAVTCEVGQPGQEDYVKVQFNQSDVEFQFGKSQFSSPRANMVTDGVDTMALLNGKVTVTTNGVSQPKNVVTLVYYIPQPRSITLGLIVNGKTEVPMKNISCL